MDLNGKDITLQKLENVKRQIMQELEVLGAVKIQVD